MMLQSSETYTLQTLGHTLTPASYVLPASEPHGSLFAQQSHFSTLSLYPDMKLHVYVLP